MMPRLAFLAAAVGVAAFALWHPARAPIAQSTAAIAAPAPSSFADFQTGPRRHGTHLAGNDDLVVYVAGAVRKPGLYHLQAGDRNAKAIALAGGLSTSADAGAVNLAQRVADGDMVFVPAAGEMPPRRASGQRHPHRRHAPPPSGSIDVNRSSAAELSAVPGIGRTVAQRIVELRAREGSFASLDELLDVAGMTQTRLERARPYLRQP
jgi:competence protein ComEA